VPLRYRAFVFVVLLLAPALMRAVDPDPVHPTAAPTAGPAPTTDVIVFRTAESLDAPHRTSYRLAEWAQQRGRWILPDIGYYDTGYARDQLWFAGAGAELTHRSNCVWTEEIYLAQAAGPEAHNERSMWLWTVFDVQLHPKLTAQLVSYPTLPLNRSQSWGFDVDRGKLEWAPSAHWRIGPGYSATTLAAGHNWLSKPFLTATRKTRSGDYEFWLQKTATGAQVQFRYMLVRDERRRTASGE